MADSGNAIAEQPVVVGRIQGPFGIKGWVHVNAYTDPPENLTAYRPWMLRRAGGNQDWREAAVVAVKPHKQGFVAQLRGIEDRTAAESLQGTLIGVPASQLPAPAADEYYWRDLIDARVVDQDERLLGQVASLLETGAHDVLVITPDESLGAVDDLLIPFHRRYVHSVQAEPGADGRAVVEIRVDWALGQE